MVGFGTALAGLGGAQPQIMAMQQDEARKRQQALIAQALMQQQMQGGAPPQGMPPQTLPPQPPQGGAPSQGPMPGGAPMPSGGGAPPPQPGGQPPMPSPQALASPVQPPGGAQGALPDFNQFLSKINMMPGTGADKGAVIMQMLPIYASQWSAQNEQNYKQQELAIRKITEGDRIRHEEVDEAQQNKRIGLEGARVGIEDKREKETEARDARSDAQTTRKQDREDKKEDEKERYDRAKETIDNNKLLSADKKSEAKQKLLEEHYNRMDDINAGRLDNQTRATNSKIIQGEEGLKIKQENADTNKSRAETAATSAGSKVKLDAAKIQQMQNKVPPENKKPFQAARDQYTRASAFYKSLTRPGAMPAASAEDIKYAKDKMDAAADNMVKLASGPGGSNGTGTKEKIKPGEEIRKDAEGNIFVNRNGQAVPAEY